MANQQIEGQLSEAERRLLTEAIVQAPKKPAVVVEVGTWLGGGSTLHILRALEQNGAGHLWGVEADRSIYERMLANIRAAAPEASHRFTAIFGRSEDVLPQWISAQGPQLAVDLAFLDGGDSPMEQILEFGLLDPHIPVGGQLMAHDAKMRKGKFFSPYLARLDHWECQLLDSSEVGLLRAVKRAPQPSPQSLRAARAHLLRQRLHPLELAAVVVPKPIRALVARCLSQRLVESLGRG